MDRVLFGFNTIFIFRYPLMKRRMEKVVRKIRAEATEEELAELAAMEHEEMLKTLKIKAEAEIDRSGVYLQKEEISDEEEEEEDSGDDEESKGSPSKAKK